MTAPPAREDGSGAPRPPARRRRVGGGTLGVLGRRVVTLTEPLAHVVGGEGLAAALGSHDHDAGGCDPGEAGQTEELPMPHEHLTSL